MVRERRKRSSEISEEQEPKRELLIGNNNKEKIENSSSDVYQPPEYIIDLLGQIQENAKVDRLDLDSDWEKLPYIILQYTDALSDMERAFGTYMIELDRRIREEVLRKEGKQASETKVENLTRLDTRYIEMNYWMSRLKNAVKSLEFKRKSLEGENQLYVSGYFSTPNHKKLVQYNSWNMNNEKSDNQRNSLNRRR